MQQSTKKSLSFIWAKESDLSETYEFVFTSKDLGCIRKNAAGERKFRLSFDAEGERLWWGETYFLDPGDLTKKPERAHWYRASDTAKRRAAFVWHRREARPLCPEPSPAKAVRTATGKPAAFSARFVPKVLTKASALQPTESSTNWPNAAESPFAPKPRSPPGPAQHRDPSVPTPRPIEPSTSWPKTPGPSVLVAPKLRSPPAPAQRREHSEETGQQSLKKLGYVWAKESDLSETYEFVLSGKELGCVRKNATGERKFRIAYDSESERLWWGESYFLDPADLSKKPERAHWYRASDTSKHRAAFVWHRREARPLCAEHWASKAGRPSAAATTHPVPKLLTKASATQAAGKVRERSEAPVRQRPQGAQAKGLPEVILDLDQMAVIYKPCHWRCELPSKDALVEESEGRTQRDPLLLLRWIREKMPSIDEKLFEEDFNPALSGTGFGPLAHRIDQETSGPMLVAKTVKAQRFLKSQFHKTEVSKRYICLVHGRVSKASGVIDVSIRTFRTDSLTLSEVSTAGEWAETSYEVVATYSSTRGGSSENYSLVACDIKSGRTHQIRVHMQHLGHSLVADDKYLSEERLAEDRTWCPRLFLHSFRLSFRSLQNQQEVVVCPLPDDLKAALLRLGAADPGGHACDNLFGETSWQRELFRPPIERWRPGTRTVRRVAALLAAAPGPLSLMELGADSELQNLLLEEDGASSLSKSWFSRHWRYFEAVPRQLPNGNSQFWVRLRPEHAAGEGDEEHDLERRIEAVRSELEELQRLKQRAVAEEEYHRAAGIKKRLEASNAELMSLLELAEPEVEERPDAAGALGAEGDAEPEPRQRKERPKREAFSQDVHDEALFPSLPTPAAKPASKSPLKRSASAAPASGLRATGLRSASLGPLAASSGAAGTRAASVAPQPVAAQPVAAQRAAPAVSANAAAAAAEENPRGLKEELQDFLRKREGSCAHINEVNNDKFLRQVMAAERPKPVQAVNKVWLKQHEDTFTLLRTEDNEMYVALSQTVNAKAQSVAAAAAQAASAQRSPAYHQVIQRTAAGDSAPPLVYKYSVVARREDPASSAKSASSSAVAVSWQDKFSNALKEIPQRFCSAEELLRAVPLFAEAMGTHKTMEIKELLVLFLEGFPDTFKVEKRGYGSDRQVIVWAR